MGNTIFTFLSCNALGKSQGNYSLIVDKQAEQRTPVSGDVEAFGWQAAISQPTTHGSK